MRAHIFGLTHWAPLQALLQQHELDSNDAHNLILSYHTTVLKPTFIFAEPPETNEEVSVRSGERTTVGEDEDIDQHANMPTDDDEAEEVVSEHHFTLFGAYACTLVCGMGFKGPHTTPQTHHRCIPGLNERRGIIEW